MSNIDILYNKINKGREGKNIGWSTGIQKLDGYIGGIQPSLYTLIFGVSGGGKSALALYSYIYRPLKDHPDDDFLLVYFSLELSAELLLAKLLCIYLYEEYSIVIPYTKLMSWREILSDEDYAFVLKGKQWLESINKKLVIYDSHLTSKYFYRQIKGLLEEQGTFEYFNDGENFTYTKNNPNQLILVVVDHLNLTTPVQGHTKKEEIDTISKYAVYLRNKFGISFVMLMQENRNSSSMDRRKAELTECSSEDIADSSAPFQDSEICIGVYYPLKFKLKSHRGYPIIVEGNQSFNGLRGRYRSIQLIKNRQGESEKAIPLNFFGEIGYWKELPKADEIQDFTPYLHLTNNEETQNIDHTVDKKEFNYTF